MNVGLGLVAEGVEELTEPASLSLDACLMAALARELPAELKVVAGEGSEGIVRGPGTDVLSAWEQDCAHLGPLIAPMPEPFDIAVTH